jgi:cytochrome c-type biogenesis protein CcmF
MVAEIGTVLVALALATAVYSAIATWVSIRRADGRWATSGRNAVYATAGLLALAVIVLLGLFLSNQFAVRYVALHSARALPTYLKVSALWAGQEGSLLLWCFLQALFAGALVARPAEHARPLLPWATVFLSLITAFFVGATLFLSNPFIPSPSVPADGQGMNPLLRHPGMVFHPPALYLGYVGLAVPLALALAALITRQIEDWPAVSRRWTLLSWLFLGIGLLLGARWAYDVLGWGGYWGWDPVENAGLMPWLTATALLHGTAMQDQRRGFRAWNTALAVLSFVLVLFGTFTTRSGLIQSVHAFSRSSLGPFFLGFIGLTLAGSVALIIVRALERPSILASDQTWDSLLSREGSFFLTIVLLLAITFSVFMGSVLPTITQALGSGRFEAGAEWFDRVVGPQLGALVLLMGVCPLLGTAAASLKRLKARGLPAVLGAALVTVLAAIAGFTQPVTLIAFAVTGLAGAATLSEYARDAASRSRRNEENPLQALLVLFGRNRRKYGGYLVHTGVILMAVGVIGTRSYAIEQDLVISQGEETVVGSYTLRYDALRQTPSADHLTTEASVLVSKGDRVVTTIRPQAEQYSSHDQTVTVPAIRSALREDLYLILAGWNADGTTITLKAFINPLASFLWLGGLVFLMGGAVAAWPVSAVTRAPGREARRRRALTQTGIAMLALILVAAGFAMWGGDIGSELRPARLQPGALAAEFDLRLWDGSSLSLANLRGQVVVINFWASWCPPCRDELPDLQTVWQEYQDRGVTLIGVSFQDDNVAARQMAAEFGLTYPMGFDVDDRMSTSYGITGVPETFVIDAEGRVAYVHVGPVTAEQLRSELDALLPAR